MQVFYCYFRCTGNDPAAHRRLTGARGRGTPTAEVIKLLRMRFSTKKQFVNVFVLVALFTVTLSASCDTEPAVKTTIETIPTSTASTYLRQSPTSFRGIDEPQADAWRDLVLDRERLKQDGFNAVLLSPPVLITQRAGGKPRVILEEDAGSVPRLTDDLHQAGLAVLIAPTTAAAGYKTEVEPNETTLRQLSGDAVRWARTAEEKQAELFSPLAGYNLALGTDNANRWSAGVLPLVRENFHGPVVAQVIPDIGKSPPMGTQHDFEKLDFKGYDYLMLDIHPQEGALDPTQLQQEIDDLLKRANAVAGRDGLKGVLIEFGAWREAVGTDTVDGPLLGEDGQALMAERITRLAGPQVKGIFWRGWTLPGRGAKGYKVEEALKKGMIQ